MIIDKAKVVSAGSGRMAAELAVYHGGELKLITVDGDIIIGRNRRNGGKMLWFATSWGDLMRRIGAANAVNVYKQFKSVWKWPVNIEDERDIQTLESLIDFVSSASKLSDNWQQILNSGYPFKEAFDLLLIDLMYWQRTVISKVENNDWEN